VEYDIDPEAENFPVLSFLIHPIIENALKYGMQTCTLPLKLFIKAEVKNRDFSITICNSGLWIEHSGSQNNERSTGTGLDNVRKRLQNAFPDNHSLSIDTSNNKVCVSIKIRSRE
jgi:LytS/YehU family sensor histidine kinase